MPVTFPLTPHQTDALQKLRVLDGRAGLFISMGGGKTRIALAYLMERLCRRVLVVLPLSVTSVWEREARIVDFPLPIIDLTEQDGVRLRAERMKALGKDSAMVLVNYESYWREPLRSQILRWAPDAVILDEAHRVRHRGSRQARFAGVLGDSRRGIKTKLALTGTPVTNGLQDIWSIYRFLDTSVFGASWANFANRYLLMGGFQFRQITGYQNVNEARQKLSDSSFQWEGRTFDVPRDIPIMVRLQPPTRASYNELKKKAVAEIHDAATNTDRTVIARIALTLLLRLQQIACGFTRDVGEDLVEVGTEKAVATIDLIEDAVAQKQRVVVFARFLHDLDLLERMMPAGIRTTRIDGGVPPLERKVRIANFDQGKYDVIVCQVKAASLGIDLASASIAIFYSVGFSLDEFLQAKGRLAGALRQRHAVTYYHMLAQNTVDETVYQALIDKTVIARRVTELSYALNLFGGP